MQNIKLIVIMVLLGNVNMFAQPKTLTLTSNILNEERQILIGLPDSYEYDGGDFKYPLLLLTDAEWHFDMVCRATKLLYQNGFPKIIVAAIINNNRGKDLTFSNTPEIDGSGNAYNFYRFINEELLKRLEEDYRISDFRTLMGHSLGGLFAAYSITQNTDAFDAIVAITPTIRWDNFKLLDSFTSDLMKKLNKSGKPIFIGIGSETGPEREGVLRLKKLFESHHFSSFAYKEYLDESHVTVPWKAYFDGIKFIFDPFQLPAEYSDLDFSKTMEYYKKVGSTFDYDKRVPQRILFNRGYGALEADNNIEARKIFEYYKQVYPNVPIPYTALGDINFDLKKYPVSKENYEMAYKLFPTDYVKKRIEALEKLID
ncbi:alpha/beta hydrolase-fold protein [Flagellimonas sp.]|uniref:alpha/beta hydrolase-fold protein n=1 Tax=Flagellimonas sp. TaxID=2058762 RepID=UPI003B5BD69C